jgi:hypothetical protein
MSDNNKPEPADVLLEVVRFVADAVVLVVLVALITERHVSPAVVFPVFTFAAGVILGRSRPQ